MKNNVIEYKGQKYELVFNLNVMEQIQEEYKTIDKWGELTDGSKGEPNAKAIIFGLAAMINEGIDIENEEKGYKDGSEKKPLTLKQVGRMLSEVGLKEATEKLNNTVIESTETDKSKNE